ncbi:MAG: ABC transporter ATP-binding protein [Chloroflexi bacterium]|nr:ABC transporter ATP-binding protein [Chloroflexota bacterium]
MIVINNLVKKYGKLTAVQNLTLQVEQGAIFGFVGPNGAGKTSTMRILTTLMSPTSGEAFVAGNSVTKNPRGVRRAIGYMPDFFGVYDDMTVWEYLDFFGACYEVPVAQRASVNKDLLELVDLTSRRDDRVEALSRGMKQRLGLARTLAHDPQVLILDEPASGLDPRARIEIRELLVELARMGKTIFFSTHILADVAEICTHV